MSNTSLKFIVDNNVGKLAKWLRMVGYDTKLFSGENDSDMIDTALAENRVVLTRDTRILERRVITSGQLKAILIQSDRLDEQIRQVVATLKLDKSQFRPFTLCLECNQPLIKKDKAEVKNRVPPYVFQTQHQFVECPVCHRIYWQGTHWQSMTGRIKKLDDPPASPVHL